MAKQHFKSLDHRVYDLMAKADQTKGMHGWEMTSALRVAAPRLYNSIDRLKNAGYIEARWQDQNWSPRAGSSNTKAQLEPTQPGVPRRRYYRVTGTRRQTLAARIQSEKDQL